MRIDICLATYNGALWINDFLNSLDTQTYNDWRLIVSDDASQDATLALIKTHFESMPEKLVVVQRTCMGEGVVKNFEDAIEATDAEYILLADQDDVWLPEKLASLYLLMCQIEQDRKVPMLIFSDLEVVDEQLSTLNKSWWAFISVKPNWVRSFKRVLYYNIVPGCSMMLNRSLLKMALPLPKGIVMHDWWFLLVCLAFGNVAFCNKPLVRYRRHPKAHTYQHKGGIISVLQRQYTKREAMHKNYRKSVKQAQAFELMFEEKMNTLVNGNRALQVLHDYIKASKSGWWMRRWLWMKSGIYLPSVLATIKFYICI